MEPLGFFSAEELSVWAGQRLVDDFRWLSGLLLKLVFLLSLLFTGLNQALRGACERLAGWIYGRPALGALAARAPALVRIRRGFERLSDPSGGRKPDRWLVDAFYPVGMMWLWVVLLLPFAFFGSYILGHERDMATMSLGLWWTDWIKSITTTSLLYALLGLGLFGLARRLPRTWWLWLWGAVVGMLALWSMLSPIRAELYNEFKPLPEGPTRQAIEELMQATGYELEHIQVIDTSKRSKAATAFVMGDGPTRRVVLGDNLVRAFHPREIRVALAHELGHELQEHSERTWLTLAAAALVFLFLVRLLLWIGPRIPRLGLRPDADPASLPLIMLLLLFLFLVNQPLSAWLDRAEEVEADLQALELTRDPVAYCSLMVRLARTNQADVDPPPLHHWFWGHHPSVAQRLRLGTAWADQNGITMGRGAIPLPTPTNPEPSPPKPGLEDP